ncbi:MAG: 4-(cytidine 5'-diphospho)-2-C-methyl-D-erythritol kinase [Gammaproteobacteria bacterium]|nr:MAG: 4-(cytidine 5'-diphospho)-2-C-methyl-D-erythritol kinase [Gammaproteobacteria bacterium]
MINKNINTTFEFPSPAKLNLFLHVVGQRADGYHELETLFQFIDYSDTIKISISKNADIELLTPIKGVRNEDNLIIKAARLLQNHLKERLKEKPKENQCTAIYGAKISIEKILPMGGGLGGGSSNAATILVALNELWQAHLSNEELALMGLSLGADIPVFIYGFSAFAQGVGEQLTPVYPKECWYLVTQPDVSISTASVFSSIDLPRNTARIVSSNFNADYKDEDLFISLAGHENKDKYHNDCQTMVIKHYDQVAKLLAWLVEYAPSRMTGTGACVFSRFSSQQEACDLQAKLPVGISSFVAQGLNKSPLRSVIEQFKSSN